MAKTEWKAGNMLYPLPAVLVTSKSGDGVPDVCTVAWCGTVCTNPPMLSISLRPSRKTYENIMATGVFVMNVPGEDLARATDYCGVRSGKNEDKFKAMNLTVETAPHTDCPMLAEAPVSIECKVNKTEELGSHTMFIADVLAVHVEESFVDEQGGFHFSDCRPLVYSHGEYCGLGKSHGTFGWSVRKKKGPSLMKKGRKKRKDYENFH